jgi:homoserine dehydrogenase
VALLGVGTVGSAVAARLVDDAWRAALTTRGLRGPELVVVGVRDTSRPTRLDLPERVERTAQLDELVGRDDVDAVVELIGGTDDADRLVTTALERGKAVVTANKKLLARRGAALEATARSSGAALRFEAAVAGGVPVLGPLARELAANRWRRVRGIVNGTTNHILSRMFLDDRSYEGALAEAQAEGYAEADPTADVEGHDAADKLAILVRLAYGAWPDVSAIPRAAPTVDGTGAPGVTGLTADEMRGTRGLGLRLRLVAQVERVADGRLATSAAVCAVPAWSALGETEGVTNAVELDGEPVGRVTLRGPGAGGAATSSSVLGDLLAVGGGAGSTWGSMGPAGTTDVDAGLAGERRWFFVSRRLARLSDDELPGFDRDDDSPAFVSRPMTLARIRDVLRGVGERAATLYPVLDLD